MMGWVRILLLCRARLVSTGRTCRAVFSMFSKAHRPEDIECFEQVTEGTLVGVVDERISPVFL